MHRLAWAGGIIEASTRQRLLADMGVDVWRLRSSLPESSRPASVGRESQPGQIAEGAAPEPVPEIASGPHAATPEAGTRRVATAGPEHVAGDAPLRAAGDVTRPGDVVPAAHPRCEARMVLIEAGAWLLVAPLEAISEDDRRFLRDVARAACGDWSTRPVPVTFEWPQTTLDESRSGAVKALGALLAKCAKRGAHGVLRFGVDDLLDDANRSFPADAVNQFGEPAVCRRSVTEKRQLWQLIQQRRR